MRNDNARILIIILLCSIIVMPVFARTIGINSITPNKGTRDFTISVIIYGQNFVPGDQILISNFPLGGHTLIDAENEILLNPSAISCTLTIPSYAEIGLYNVYYYRRSGEKDHLGKAFTVQAADLTSLTFTPPRGSVNRTFTIKNAVKNNGDGNAKEFDVVFYISTDNTFSTDDRFIGSRHYSSMNSKEEGSVEETSFNIDNSIPAGSYYIGMVIDPPNIVVESNELNNVRFDAGRITISEPISEFKYTMNLNPLNFQPIVIFNLFEPIVNFTANPTSGPSPLTVQFDASKTSDPDGISKYEWHFGDGSTAQGVKVSHQYMSAGEYYANLAVTDNGNPARTGINNQLITVTNLSSESGSQSGDSSGSESQTGGSSKGKISISSQPSGALVYIDNIVKGKTPCQIEDIVSGKHTVSVEMQGYSTWSTEIDVTSGSTATLFATLTQTTTTTSSFGIPTSLPLTVIPSLVALVAVCVIFAWRRRKL